MFQTLQNRLVKELALNGIVTVEAANLFLRAVYIPAHNARFAIPDEQPGTAFVAIPGVELDEILCVQEERQVGNDNCVSFNRLKLQIWAKSSPRTFRQGAGEGAPISRRNPRHFPRAAMPWPLRQDGRPPGRRSPGRTKSRLNPLGGEPVDGLDKPPTCPPRPQENKNRRSGHLMCCQNRPS